MQSFKRDEDYYIREVKSTENKMQQTVRAGCATPRSYMASLIVNRLCQIVEFVHDS